MRSGILIPIENHVLAIVFIAALIITLLWLVFEAISHNNKKSTESSFNRIFSEYEPSTAFKKETLSDLLENMPYRKANIDGGTLIYWTNGGPIAIAIARGNPQSSFKVFIRVSFPAGDLGHKMTVSSPASRFVTFRLSAESLIFSDKDSTFYDTDHTSLLALAEILEEKSCAINNTISIPDDIAGKIIDWISRVTHVHKKPLEKLLIGD